MANHKNLQAIAVIILAWSMFFFGSGTFIALRTAGLTTAARPKG